VVNVARFLDISAEEALQGTISKFIERFKEVEAEIAKRGNMTLDEMDEVWNRTKKKDKHER
ncbi:MAG: nucleoside triphosphate pyrophosphohydrolase, partial [bacterium]